MHTLKFTLSIFFAAVQKETVQQWRTKRFLIVIAVFLLIGLGSPMLIKLTPELLKSEPGGEALIKALPPLDAAQAMGSYIKTIGSFGWILAVLLGMNVVAGEKESGTASLILSKPMPRWVFVLSKFISQSLVYTIALFVGSLAAFYATVVLFGPVDIAMLIQITLLILLWFLSFVGAALLASVLGQTVAVAAGIGLGLSVLFTLASSIPQIGKWTPGELMAWATGLLENAEKVAANPGAIAGTLALIVICLIGSVAIFDRQEIQ